MNLRDLAYLVALAEHRHFGRAADACFVSQPTLSAQIKKLEDELGVSLIERMPRKLLLTQVGQAIAQRAKGVLAEIEQIRGIAQRNRDPESGRLRLGVLPTLGPYLLPHAIPRLRERFPRLELRLVEEKTAEIIKRLREGALDAGILALPIPEDALHTAFLFEEPFVLAVPERHPLSRHKAPLHPAELAHERLLLLEEGHCLRDQALAVCHSAGAAELEGFRATSLETLRQMVAADVGITLLPMLSVKPPVPLNANLRLLDFATPAPSRRLALVWRKRSALQPLLECMASTLRTLPPELLEPLRR